ncbi:2-succinyl-5-enolpyruvyl-6-hydroxy-3-cyclohexene-1-carboxylic-acid synthase [Halosegnis longus]|uniref:2-succinyl-5-enolpyruvyl-6-hydroxy-3- cyclohexene-1-carboxylic-acid synthase n=1 Tax=Halosegnis longus TaxID=2216012 RepID=UPI00096AA0A6|nr:2-succinyl-5-enolpyruvyl-6-hydroxy-3-cyclohexene-1-carboxylic-acid synthase [Salella cibi]
MTPPNVNTLWGETIVDELAKAGVDAAVLSPGSRSTPLTVAFAHHPDIETYSQLDERSAAFFALGRAKQTGKPTPLVCTSGTALANYHPAVMEAGRARVPMLLLTADRPPELDDSGANQTVSQSNLYGDSLRHQRTLPEPEVHDRKLRALRTAISRSVATTTATNPGPVHLNVPFRKPLEPTVETDDVSEAWLDAHPLAAEGRDGPFVQTTQGTPTLAAGDHSDLVSAIGSAERGLIVCGPADEPTPDRGALAALARTTGFPVLADPLSGLRFGPHTEQDGVTILGGYDAWADGLTDERAPDLVLRFGASPTSKPLRKRLAALATADRSLRQYLVDPAGGWREAEFAATETLVAEPTRLARSLADRLAVPEETPYADRLAALERAYWPIVADEDHFFEGQVVADALARAPDPSTVFVSNSMPVRDMDRFARPSAREVTTLGNRGVSGIDGITSTALGAKSASDDPLVLVTGDLAYYHDTNGLLALDRFGLDATIVLINNDGGGIFHLLPIEAHDTFEGYFRTPHGLDFSATADLHSLSFARTSTREGFREAYAASLDQSGTQVIEVRFDSDASHRVREQVQSRVEEDLL